MSANSASPAPTSNPTSASNVHQNVVPSEVGWQFVRQYYSFVHKQPKSLHCFYTKNSTFIYGTEGEDGRPCYGQLEIHQKILSIGFQDCKVFVHSVDAQASANNGIILQVIGEMSNRGEPWRKFVQTFFLAEQPNGYYVLNDIFRFLKEETVEDDEIGTAGESQPEPAPAAPIHVEPIHVEPEPPVTNVSVPAVPAPAPPPPAPEPALVQEPVREAMPEPEPAPAPTPVEEPPRPQPNGLHHPEPKKEPEPVVEPVVEPPAPQEPVREPTPPPAPAPAPAPAPVPAPDSIQPQLQQQQAPPHPPQPTQPPAPKTWANLAAADSKKWGSAVAQESRGVTVEAAPVQHQPPRSGTGTPVSGSATGGSRTVSGEKNVRTSNQGQQAPATTSPQVFVKGLVDPMRNEDLENLLAQFGKIKNIEFVRSSGCAFVEYEDVKNAQRAITVSLNKNQGGEGGIFFKKPDNDERMRVYVETRKERGERPPPRGRGGVPQQSNRGGNFRGRGRGRGVPASAGKSTWST
ncbi:hypothetical protein ACEPAF_1580 [Sanghuangporus sanghuang]